MPRATDLRLDGGYQGGFRTSYLELPILARIESPPIGLAALYAVAGPTLSFLLRSETENGAGFVADTTDITTRMDFGLAAGVGATVGITPRLALGFETRYTHGFVTVDETREFQVENRAIVFSLGMTARFGMDEAVSSKNENARHVSVRDRIAWSLPGKASVLDCARHPIRSVP